MISNVEYDFSNLTEKVSGLGGALLGRGATSGDLQKVLDTETGQLAGRMGDAVGPKTQEAAMKRVDRDIKQYLTILPAYSNLDEDQQYSSRADFSFISAGHNYLLGINDEDNQTKADGASALAMLRSGQKKGYRGLAYEHLGHHSERNPTQEVLRLNRTRVSRAAFNFVRANIRQKTGELRAAFYRVAVKYVPTKRVPNWILSKIEQAIAKGKSTLEEGGRGTEQAFIEFAARAPGVTSNARITAKVQGAIKQSTYILESKLQKILRGYKYDWETGKVFRDRTGEDFSDN